MNDRIGILSTNKISNRPFLHNVPLPNICYFYFLTIDKVSVDLNKSLEEDKSLEAGILGDLMGISNSKE